MQEEEPTDVEPLEEGKREAEAAIAAIVAQFTTLSQKLQETMQMKEDAKKDGQSLQNELLRLGSEYKALKVLNHRCMM